MSGLQVTLDASALERLAAHFGALPQKIRPAIRMALNDTGGRTTAPVSRALVIQTGLKRQVIRKALITKKASDGDLKFSHTVRGGDVGLKYFGARETVSGVSAAPRGQRQTFAGTFMKAGWWPKRVSKPGWNGQVFRRAGGVTKFGKAKFEKAKSGVFIPKELVIGASAEAFTRVADTVLPERLAHHIGRAMGGK